MDSTTVVAIIIAILGSGGLWSFLQWIVETKVKRHSNDLNDIKNKIDNLVTSTDIEKNYQGDKRTPCRHRTDKRTVIVACKR